MCEASNANCEPYPWAPTRDQRRRRRRARRRSRRSDQPRPTSQPTPGPTPSPTPQPIPAPTPEPGEPTARARLRADAAPHAAPYAEADAVAESRADTSPGAGADGRPDDLLRLPPGGSARLHGVQQLRCTTLAITDDADAANLEASAARVVSGADDPVRL